ncbi:hypothetical protein FE257_004184 [Aspergillus nanangensis]|uniref:Uncharacterized protein n=1 Tax=Aspergillus nanangensis TaxID=2582783 RepID=A0AAD4GV50_ASPNN|nr:hypothetical protein FE257_004184 [Aspergillus nanangensis]
MAAFSHSLPSAPLPPRDAILCVRIGKIKTIGPGSVQSAIDKSACKGPVFLTSVGLVKDEQQYALHGGVDKALHQYCASHYATWNDEIPERAHLFKVGGYGENISTSHLNETNVCIGDIFRLGPEVLVQISEPRQPCYKLNRRFNFQKASIRTQQSGRTGWYLRVLRQGYIQSGDQMDLVERINPQWSIRQIQRYLYDEPANQTALRELSELPGLGREILDLFRSRLAQGAEDMSFRLLGNSARTMERLRWKKYRIERKRHLTPRVAALDLKAQDLPGDDFLAFAHVLLRFGPYPQFVRAYSVVDGDGDSATLELAVSREHPSRGGSVYLHDKAQAGDVLEVSQDPTNIPAIHTTDADGETSGTHIFLIGGIGVTAFLREIKSMTANGVDIKIHYAVRSRQEAPYLDTLPPDKTTVYAKDQGERLSLKDVIPYSPHAKVYCCGPPSLMAESREIMKAAKYPPELMHFESFGVASSDLGDLFEAEIKQSCQVVKIPGDKSLLQVLNEAGFDIPSGCLTGSCGTCMVQYSGGSVHHKGMALPDEEKGENMLSCVSRGNGHIVIDF